MDRRLLHIYLNDHLSAMTVMRRRLRATLEANAGTDLESELKTVLEETGSHLEALREIMDELGLGRSRLKLAAAHVMERLGRLKLNGRCVAYSPLSRLEEMELFALGALFRVQLWQTLRLQGNLPLPASRLKGLEDAARARQVALDSLHQKVARNAFD